MTTKNVFIPTRILGIIDNTLYIDGLYAGDHTHTALLSNYTKSDLIDRGVKVFSSLKELDSYHYQVLYDEINADYERRK